MRALTVSMIALGLVLVAVGELDQAGADVRVTVDLVDGTRISGSTPPAVVRVTTDEGPLDVPLERIRAIHVLHQEEPTESGNPKAVWRPVEDGVVVTIPGARHIDAMLVDRESPGTLLAVTENHGARCGGGTPATVWRVRMADGSDGVPDVRKIQTLDQIQQVRQSIFRSSDGTLFTGGGWCGYKPPYYSLDGGARWQPANVGTHPPNSTFCFAELYGQVYAGTGYEPHHAQIYRWLGEGTWERVLDIPPPRSIFTSMLAHGDALFAANCIYWRDGKDHRGGVPVYMSKDGETFEPTVGIPDTHSVRRLISSRDRLFAVVMHEGARSLYVWTNGEWDFWSEYMLGDMIVVGPAGAWYVSEVVKNAERVGIYVSTSLGREWSPFAEMASPYVRSLVASDGYLYVGGGMTGDRDAEIMCLRFRGAR